jgi:hypothetical protein
MIDEKGPNKKTKLNSGRPKASSDQFPKIKQEKGY